jgi:tRNA-specific 2-thiouridylase
MRAVSLFSGGLDSMLAIKLIASQGVEVIALYIQTGFGSTKDIRDELMRRASLAGAKLLMVDVREEYIQKILFDPIYGYGKNFNPCIDCHGYMFKVGKVMMRDLDSSFLITGEVLGQRPMSQRADALKQVSLLAGDRDDKLILRPLSAKLLEPTTPEIEGWVDRECLLGISGRSREVQLRLAKEYGWRDYESPAGGCLLTETIFSKRLKEFIEYEDFGVEDIELLKFGRHFRLPEGAKLIVGRSKEDNLSLKSVENRDYIPITLPIKGPFALIHKNATDRDRELGARISITYAKSCVENLYNVRVGDEVFKVHPLNSKAEAQQYFAVK